MHFQHATDAFTLKNGVKIPCIGFGTWQSAPTLVQIPTFNL